VRAEGLITLINWKRCCWFTKFWGWY